MDKMISKMAINITTLINISLEYIMWCVYLLKDDLNELRKLRSEESRKYNDIKKLITESLQEFNLEYNNELQVYLINLDPTRSEVAIGIKAFKEKIIPDKLINDIRIKLEATDESIRPESNNEIELILKFELN